MNTTFDTLGILPPAEVEVLHLDQHLADGTTANPEWLAWRKQAPSDGTGPRITATAAAAIDGHSPYQTRYGLWLEATEQAPVVARTPAPAFVLQRGLFAEKDARLALSGYLATDPTWNGYDTTPKAIDGVLVSRTGLFDFIAASLDATVFDPYGLGQIEAIGEFKLNGAARHQFALDGRLPPDHYAQVQWQLLAANCGICFYVSTPFSGDGERKIIKVLANPAYQEKLLSDVVAFRLAVVSLTPPDTVGGAQEAVVESAVADFLVAKAALQDVEAEVATLEATLRAVLTSRGHSAGFHGCGISYELESRRGSVSWEKVLKAMNVTPTDEVLEATRGKSSQKMTLKVTEESDGFLANYRQKASATVCVESAPKAATAW